jgi:peptidoglycan hydrolase-like protein with peptidoglycan-binding domain
MRKAVLLIALSLVACNRERTYTSSSPSSGPAGTWVAQPGDLSAEQVRIVQRSLGDRGFPIELTGKFDEATRTALADFQRSRGLPSTGNLGTETAAALGIDPQDVMPVRGATPAKDDEDREADTGAHGEPPPARIEPGY